MTKKSKKSEHSKNLPTKDTGIPQSLVSSDSKVLATIEAKSTSFSGPLPPPSILQKYESILPGSAERIFRMAEGQATHRQSLESTVVKGDSKRANNGLVAGAIIAILFLAGAIFLIYNGHDWAGATLGTANIVGLVGVFIYGTKSRRSERSQKQQEMNKVRQE